jgi:O-antigen/teichoic acid export membrane protein
LVNVVYRLIFKEEITADVKTFLKNLLWVGIATSISTAFVIIFTIVGGRKLGPQEYGKFVLIQSVAMFLNIPMQLGFTFSLVKYTSEKEDFERQSSIITTTYTLVLLLTIMAVIIFIIFTPWLSNAFSISTGLFRLAIAFAGITVFYTLTTSVLRGLNMMKAYSVFQVVYGSVTLLSFFIFIIFKNITFGAMLFPMFIAYCICTLAIFVLYMGKITRFNFESSLVKLLFKYALFSTISGVSLVLYTNIDKIMISKYLNVNYVGIYNAYYVASINGASVIFNMFIQVFFPTVSKYENKGVILKRINRFVPYLIILGMPIMVICECVVMKFYGNQYPFNWVWILLASVASVGFIIEGLYLWLLSSAGSSGVKIAATGAAIIAAINIGLNIVLIPLMKITGSLISLIISLLFGTVFILYYGRNYLKN